MHTTTNHHTSQRKTKIIATLGPASKSEEMIAKLIVEGVNIFRLNFSHGSHEEHLKTLLAVRTVAKKLNSYTAVLQDLSGPKIRITSVDGDFLQLKDQSQITLKMALDHEISNNSTIFVEGLDPANVLEKDEPVLLSDGLIVLQVTKLNKDSVECIICKGGRLRSRAGIAFPDSMVDLPATTEKDLIDLKWGLENNVDFIALSFVKNAEDILNLKKQIEKNIPSKNLTPKLIAKIERKQALSNINEIIKVTDGIMIARGDLGLELPLEKVPHEQKNLITLSNEAGIPVIVATQMLHSMVTSARPTRAEVSDIAQAVISGTDAVMLSEETAIGEHPEECVKMLSKIALEAEKFYKTEYKAHDVSREKDVIPDGIAFAAVVAANKISSKLIIACTETGTTARLVSKHRPSQMLYGASIHDETLRKLSIYYGVLPIKIEKTSSHSDEIEEAIKAVKVKEGIKEKIDVVVIGGLSVQKPGSTNVLEILTV